MRCKKHYTDFSSTVGVCACCLRERLLSLIAAQEQALLQIQTLDGKLRNSDKNPASVSPFIHSRKSDHSDHHHHHHHTPAAQRHHHSFSDQLFYTTPQVRPNTATADGYSNKKRRFIRFFSFPNIFRSRNRNSVDSVITDPTVSDSAYRESYGGGNATSSTSWFSSIYNGRRRRNPSVNVDESTVNVTGPDESTVTGRRPVRRNYCRDRGMSPVRNSDVAGQDVDELSKDYESTESVKNTPRRTPARRGGGHVRNLSGLTFCLSPLVRASPNRHWNPPENALSGEIRVPVKPHLSDTKLFCANRSRKLADFGRPNLNR